MTEVSHGMDYRSFVFLIERQKWTSDASAYVYLSIEYRQPTRLEEKIEMARKKNSYLTTRKLY